MSLSKIWQSTAYLHERFANVSYDNPLYLTARWEKLAEEYREFTEAEDADDLCKEAVDVIVTLIGVLQARGIPLSQLEDGVNAVIAKNGAKTHETHKLEGFTIVRR